MTIYFGENLKRLRKEKELTQETLAEIFGVSFQTISKWERGETYPDITMLPVISSYFNVSVDSLLGVDKAQKEQKINEYMEIYDAMRLKDTPATFKIFKTAVKEIPGDYRLLVRYMELLMAEKTSRDLPEYEKVSRELMSIYEYIQNHCTDDSIRMWSKRLICQHLHTKSYYTNDDSYQEQAELILSEMPDLINSREYLSTMLISDAEKHKNACIDSFENLLYLLQCTTINFYYYDENFDIKEKIKITKALQELFNVLFPNVDNSKNSIHKLYNYGHLGHWYFEIGDEKNAICYLKLAAEYAKELDKLEVTEKNARFYEQEKVYHEMKMCTRMKELMKKHYPLSDEFKSKPEFQEIIKMLE